MDNFYQFELLKKKREEAKEKPGLPKIEIGKIYTNGRGLYRKVVAISKGPHDYTAQDVIIYKHIVKKRPKFSRCCYSSFRAFAREEWIDPRKEINNGN